MPKALSLDLRQRIVSHCKKNTHSRKQTAEIFNVSYAVITKLLKQERVEGNLEPKYHKSTGRPRKITNDHEEKLLQIIEETPDITLEEMRDELGVDCTIQTILYALERRNISYKKTLHASEQEREDVKKGREEWRKEQPKLDPSKLVFLDESGAKTNMTRLRGRAQKGTRLYAYAPESPMKSHAKP